MRKRQANIEFARVIACYIVICIHTVTWYTNADGLLENSLLIRCFLTDGVPVFWYIMGYFLFANPNASHRKRAKKTVKTLLIPTFCVMVFSQIWQDWITADIGQVSFLSCLDMHSFDFHNLFGNILRWSDGMTFGGHFWYVFSYVQVLLWAPLLAFVCVDTPRANKTRRYLMVLCGLYLLNRDVSNLWVLTLGGKTYPLTVHSVINTTLLFVLMGYETWLHRDWIRQRAGWLKWLGLAGFVVFNLLKYALTVRDMRIDTGDSYFLGSSTLEAYLASYGLFIFAYCQDFRPGGFFERVCQHLGAKTLGIYLIHGCVFRKLKAIGLRDWVYTGYRRNPELLAVEAVCTLVYAVLVFAVCYLLVLCFDGFWHWMKRALAGRSRAEI